jgi:hypothetical protein
MHGDMQYICVVKVLLQPINKNNIIIYSDSSNHMREGNTYCFIPRLSMYNRAPTLKLTNLILQYYTLKSRL